MANRFFSKPVWLFGNVAIMILCAVFFLVPFALRGARMAVQDIRNEVTDWLPNDFPETEVLAWFRPRFVGDQFVAISWDGCSRGEPAYDTLVAKLEAESVEGQSDLSPEELRVKQEADKLGLQQTDEQYHSNWGQRGERWLLGKKKQWYYITKEGKLYRWNGKNNAFAMAQRSLTQFLYGGFEAAGEPVREIPVDPRYYENPKLICSRFFKSIQSGPEILESLIGENGPLKSMADAELEAHKRLTGNLFGPTPSLGFAWTKTAFVDELTRDQFAKLPDGVEEEFELYVNRLLSEPQKGKYDYNGDIENLKDATQEQKLEHWYNFFKQIKQPMPPRQTAIIAVLNPPVVGELDRIVGREILGKPMGRIRYLAHNECDISKDELHLGGPPCDNVAIDEEGTVTLVRLVGLSSLVGLIVAYVSFRSVTVTMMVFFVGCVSAVSSLGIVWYANSQLDAILLTMPSLVYVLGLSGAVHIVNYYREACHDHGHRGAAETAVRYGWFPCTLAALTTSLGLISLYVSNLIPIKKFGLFSAIGTLVTVALMFTYLPASLKLFPPGYRKRRPSKTPEKTSRSLYDLTNDFWLGVGNFVIRRHAMVMTVVLIGLVVAALGIFKIRTSVQLIKLFDPGSDVVQDYVWMEKNLGKLVPMEIVLGFDRDVLDNDEETVNGEINLREIDLKFSRLERIEAGAIVREELERAFGETGQNIVGKGLSTDNFLPFENERNPQKRKLINQELANSREALFETGQHGIETDPEAERNYGYEFWRISLRLGALNNVDYGLFVSDLKSVVEPVLSAFKYRTRVLRALTTHFEEEAKEKGLELSPRDQMKGSVLLLGYDDGRKPPLQNADLESFLWKDEYYDQTHIFCRTLVSLLQKRGFSSRGDYRLLGANSPEKKTFTKEQWQQRFETYDCIVLIRDHESYDLEKIKSNAKLFIDARDHRFPDSWGHDDIRTARERRVAALEANEPTDPDQTVIATYSGIVPIVYKAQRSLLESLIYSICLAFVMIAIVMMLLLRDWKCRLKATNIVNLGGGMISMLPNVFPVVLIFGLMGHIGREVDIGSMMTASVAMGVAVDDTIHFLTWFRKGLRQGMSRPDAVRLAYKRCGAAMTQTTLIGGLGLVVFGLSTFTPTQQFGILMLLLLFAALIGDLVFLPAILVGPVGRLFEFQKETTTTRRTDQPVVLSSREQLEQLDAPAESRTSGSDNPDSEDPDQASSSRQRPDGLPTMGGNHNSQSRQSTPHSNLRGKKKRNEL